jgi:hypothetical protein
MGVWDQDDDGSRPKWLPHFMRLSKDSMKQKKDFTQFDLQDIEHFAHRTQVFALIICVVWSISWCCCWQLSNYRRERRRQAFVREAMKNE